MASGAQSPSPTSPHPVSRRCVPSHGFPHFPIHAPLKFVGLKFEIKANICIVSNFHCSRILNLPTVTNSNSSMHWSGESAPKLDAPALFRETNRSSLKYLWAIIQMTGLVRRWCGYQAAISPSLITAASGQVRYAPAARPPLLPAPAAQRGFFAQISNPAHAGHMHQPLHTHKVWPIGRNLQS